MVNMYKALDAVRNAVKTIMRGIARGLNKLSRGKISPAFITYTGLVLHIPIAYLIAHDQLVVASVLLAVFGLFDTLDGELARLQNRASTRGMFLDSVTDRIKEVMVYVGIVYLFVHSDQPMFAVWAVAACGLAVCVSYTNAWGEVALAKHGGSNVHQQNKTFRSGLATYDVRIFGLVVGLLFGVLEWVVVIITLLSLLTVIQRSAQILKKLS
jgi:CDP-diacylglycerol--glycerol-3-phosphate 3-phosphatidyltransferase